MPDRPAPVMRPTYTPAEARDVLRYEITQAGSQAKFTERLTDPCGLIANYTTPRGRDLPATLARQIGLRVVKMYVPRDAP